jgi:hypothetical protein
MIRLSSIGPLARPRSASFLRTRHEAGRRSHTSSQERHQSGACVAEGVTKPRCIAIGKCRKKCEEITHAATCALCLAFELPSFIPRSVTCTSHATRAEILYGCHVHATPRVMAISSLNLSTQ